MRKHAFGRRQQGEDAWEGYGYSGARKRDEEVDDVFNYGGYSAVSSFSGFGGVTLDAGAIERRVDTSEESEDDEDYGRLSRLISTRPVFLP